MDPSVEVVSETPAVPTFQIAGFWRRVAALSVDALVLAIIGFPLGLLLGERIAPVCTPARLIGLPIIIFYFGALGSRLGKGQTPGKRLLGLRVVGANGQPLTLGRAFIRATMLSLPWICNGIQFGVVGQVGLALTWVAGILVFGGGGAIIGTYLLNRRTRQALHDIVVGSYVIQAEGIGLRAPAVNTRNPMLASIVWACLVAVGMTAMMAIGPGFIAARVPRALMENVGAIPGATWFRINNGAVWGPGRSSKVLSAVLWYRGPQEDLRQVGQQVAAAMLQYYPDADSAPTLAVTIAHGWDVGIASMVSTKYYAHTPDKWRAELGL